MGGPAHAALLQHQGALAVAGERLAVEIGPQPVQGVLLHVHYDDVVAGRRERLGHGAPEQAASDHDNAGPLRHCLFLLRAGLFTGKC